MCCFWWQNNLISRSYENKGFIFTNEISPKRAKALLKNVELMALENTVIISTIPSKLAIFYSSYFYAVLIDAPCS